MSVVLYTIDWKNHYIDYSTIYKHTIRFVKFVRPMRGSGSVYVSVTGLDRDRSVIYRKQFQLATKHVAWPGNSLEVFPPIEYNTHDMFSIAMRSIELRENSPLNVLELRPKNIIATCSGFSFWFRRTYYLINNNFKLQDVQIYSVPVIFTTIWICFIGTRIIIVIR